ncbi:MAG: hypothetical protein M5R36_21740 [Deltaproteobacteria bacterium]|nr:hypothetical protein [Deltaproteobacteria bacterium]
MTRNPEMIEAVNALLFQFVTCQKTVARVFVKAEHRLPATQNTPRRSLVRDGLFHQFETEHPLVPADGIVQARDGHIQMIEIFHKHRLSFRAGYFTGGGAGVKPAPPATPLFFL